MGRSASIALVALLHVAIIYALVTGLARRMVEVVRHPMETKIIEEAKPVAPDVPPPAPLPTPRSRRRPMFRRRRSKSSIRLRCHPLSSIRRP
jgi:hypothetical protein